MAGDNWERLSGVRCVSSKGTVLIIIILIIISQLPPERLMPVIFEQEKMFLTEDFQILLV